VVVLGAWAIVGAVTVGISTAFVDSLSSPPQPVTPAVRAAASTAGTNLFTEEAI
jgi:hypothetical protein